MLEERHMFLKIPVKPESKEFGNDSVGQSMNAVHLSNFMVCWHTTTTNNKYYHYSITTQSIGWGFSEIMLLLHLFSTPASPTTI